MEIGKQDTEVLVTDLQNDFLSEKGEKFQREKMHMSQSLYQRLGGVYSIAVVIDDFVDRIMIDPRLNANPAINEAHHKVPPPGFKYLVTEMVCWATGGPQKYTGRSMADAHRHLKIKPKEWEAFIDDLQQTLDKLKVPLAEQAELKGIVQNTYGDIVVPET